MTDGYYYCLNCHSEITPDYNEHCCFCGTTAIAVSGDYSNEEVETAFDLLNKEQEGRIIVPPCKTGDTVYWIENGTTIKSGTAWQFGFEQHLWLSISVSKKQVVVCDCSRLYCSKEEAEQALRKMKQGVIE